MGDPVKAIFIYNADSGTLEAMLDSARKLARRADACALCAVTHGIVRRKRKWKEIECALGLPSVYFHRDEIPRDVRGFLRGKGLRLPVVLFETVGGAYVAAVTASELEQYRGNPERLRAGIEAARQRLAGR